MIEFLTFDNYSILQSPYEFSTYISSLLHSFLLNITSFEENNQAIHLLTENKYSLVELYQAVV